MSDRLRQRLRSKWRRVAAHYLGRRMRRIRPGPAIISFSFDDFPRSALVTAGPLLERHGIAATYYTSVGLMGATTPTGEIFRDGDLSRLLQAGHEIGCHTFDHCDAYATRPADFARSIENNRRALTELLGPTPVRTLSYPISPPRPGNKRVCGRRFAAARAGGQSANAGPVDLNRLNAFFLEQSRDRPELARQAIAAAAAQGAWLIFATHDVAERPTRFGCTPAHFQLIVECAVASGALLLPVSRALETLGLCAPLDRHAL